MGCTEGTSPVTLTQHWQLVPGGADEHEGQKELGRGGRGAFGRFPATAIAAGGAGGGSVLSQRARPRMMHAGRTHLPRAPRLRLRCSAPASASLPPRARALCPERHHGNRHRQRQRHQPAAPASRTHAPRAHHVPETEAVRLCLAVTVTPECGSCCRHFRTKDTEAFPGSPF